MFSSLPRSLVRSALRVILHRTALASAILLTSATLMAVPIDDEPAWRFKLLDRFLGQAESCTEQLASDPNSITLLNRRGDFRMFMGDFRDAIADFEKTIAIKPEEDAGHWRLGIAYYFNGDYEKAARQFQKYYDVDDRDRETGIWKFLAQERIDGQTKARAEMLPFDKFDREPFPLLYDMFAGKITPDDVLADLKKRGLENDPQAAFFGNFYAGVAESELGHREKAVKLLRTALEVQEARIPGGPAGYMWNIARLFWERLRDDAPRK